MRCVRLTLALMFVLAPVLAQEKTGEPTDEKARKTYGNALKSLHEHKREWALDDFKKADKQDGGHCLACQKQMVKLGKDFADWKTANLAPNEFFTKPKAQEKGDALFPRHQLPPLLRLDMREKQQKKIF